MRTGRDSNFWRVISLHPSNLQNSHQTLRFFHQRLKNTMQKHYCTISFHSTVTPITGLSEDCCDGAAGCWNLRYVASFKQIVEFKISTDMSQVDHKGCWIEWNYLVQVKTRSLIKSQCSENDRECRIAILPAELSGSAQSTLARNKCDALVCHFSSGYPYFCSWYR